MGSACLILGGGRETKESVIDLSVGLVLKKKVGDAVKQGEALAVIHANDRDKLEAAKKRFLTACSFTENPVEKRTLIRGMLS